MSVGSDGFTDCEDVCNPDNYMAWSCNKYCNGFVFKATPLPEIQVPNTSDDTTAAVWIVLFTCIGVLATFLLICFRYRHKIFTFIRKLRDKRLQFPTQPATEYTGDPTHPVADIETGLLSNQWENEEDANQTAILPENASDSGVSMENSSVHTVDEASEHVDNLVAHSGLMPGNTEPLANQTDQQGEQSEVEDNVSNTDGVQDLDNPEPTKQELAIGQMPGTNYISSARSINATS